MNYTTKLHKTLTLISLVYCTTKRRDGSVNFEFPAGKGVYLQILDENFRAVQTQRSFTGVMLGKTRGCVGCHEQNCYYTPPILWIIRPRANYPQLHL